MGNSQIQFSYYKGLGENQAHEKACLNYLKTKQNTVTISNKQGTLQQVNTGVKIIFQAFQKLQINGTLKEHYISVPIFPIASLINIRFPFLMNLSLQRNFIQTIEPICQMWMPSLEVLDLSNNNITNVKALRKLHLKRLKRIYIHTNQFLQSDCLSQIPLNVEQIGISNQVNINWSFKTFIKFSDFGNKNDLLSFYNFIGNGGSRTIIIFQLMINI